MGKNTVSTEQQREVTRRVTENKSTLEKRHTSVRQSKSKLQKRKIKWKGQDKK